MNLNRSSETKNKSKSNRYTASGSPFQSKLMNKVSAALEKVENGTQTIRQTGLDRLSTVIHQFADKLNEFNKNLDLDTPTRQRALESSKKREARADHNQKRAAMKKGSPSEPSPKAPTKSGAV